MDPGLAELSSEYSPLASPTVAVIGLGYVGLPLCLAFGRRLRTVAYDLDRAKIRSYREGRDPTAQMEPEAFTAANQVVWTEDPGPLREADFVIVAVPTPVDAAKQPDLTHVRRASETAGSHLKPGAIVIFESTVYPGATQEVGVPILERASGLKCGDGFRVGYSPERINPGDRAHTLQDVVKVVSGQDSETLEAVAWLYEQIVRAGVYRAPSIRVAEAAKVIENTQRDLNIALMNELAIIFHRMGLDTRQVLETAATKWNFLPFGPGLVGGHCIGVDPYYLTYKAQMLGHHPEVILAGRRINDGMGKYVAEQTVRQLVETGRSVRGAMVAVLGLTFKEDCPDLRNSRVVDVIREIQSFGAEVVVHDPIADPSDARKEFGLSLIPWEDLPVADAVVVAIAHKAYRAMPPQALIEKLAQGAAIIDVKSVLDPEPLRRQGHAVWRL
jgi:UDP-N-acetyl-D-glucosamine/UDP-N-acetyl-D-galactosamine dehydrogenase